MNKKTTILSYLNFLEENLCFPLQGNMMKTSQSPEGLRHHLENLVKEEILTRNEQKNLLPGNKFLWFLESNGLLDQWLCTKAGSLFMGVLGAGRFSGYTVEGIVVFVDGNSAQISWDHEDPPFASKLTKKQLRKVWPVRRGDRIYVTEYKAKLYRFTKFN